MWIASPRLYTGAQSVQSEALLRLDKLSPASLNVVYHYYSSQKMIHTCFGKKRDRIYTHTHKCNYSLSREVYLFVLLWTHYNRRRNLYRLPNSWHFSPGGGWALFFESGFGHVICSGQWDSSKYNIIKRPRHACAKGLSSVAGWMPSILCTSLG